MFASKERIDEKAVLSGRGRCEYLQALVTEFQDTDKQGTTVLFICPPKRRNSSLLSMQIGSKCLHCVLSCM